MIIFFPSCELVEFYYTLFVQTLLPRPEALAAAPLPPGSTQLKFLRLHGGLEQEVSSMHSPGAKTPRTRTRPPGSESFLGRLRPAQEG